MKDSEYPNNQKKNKTVDVILANFKTAQSYGSVVLA